MKVRGLFISWYATLAIAGVFAGVMWKWPQLVPALMAKDFPGGSGAVERHTEVFLFLTLGVGGVSWFRHRRDFPDVWSRRWMLLWLAAAFYFLGEEISWGQWWFQWNTPEAWAELNRQQETNLHNTSSWLSEKPKLLLELFIYAAGLRPAGLLRMLRAAGIRDPRWIFPSAVCAPPAAYLLMCRLAGLLLPEDSVFAFFGDGEMRELAIAWFFLWYLVGLVQLLRALPGSENRRPIL